MKGAVVITGASRGIGRALALDLAGRGHPLVVSARSRDELESLAAELEARHAIAVQVVAGDLGTVEGRRALVEACAALGPLEGLVNNAGVGTAGAFESIEASRELDLLHLNVDAVVDLCHAFVPRLKGQAGAFILNVASTAAFQPVPLFATYAASKAFVLSFSQALAEELAPAGIHVMALCPGVTESGFQKAADVIVAGPLKAASAGEVAAYALKALDARRRVAVHGVLNGLLAFGTRLAPRRMLARSAGKMMEPWFGARK